MGSDSTLAQDALIHVDVVVDGVEGMIPLHAGALQDDLRHLLAAAAGKALADFHIVQIVLQMGAIQIAQVGRDGGLLQLEGLLHGAEFLLDLLTTTLLADPAYLLHTRAAELPAAA